MKGDPDMAADEIQATIERAEAKRRELREQQPEARQSAKMYRKQIAEGLDGDPLAALNARVPGKITLEPLPDGGLMAHWNENFAALLRAAGICACR